MKEEKKREEEGVKVKVEEVGYRDDCFGKKARKSVCLLFMIMSCKTTLPPSPPPLFYFING